jgi:hypothetical protein
VDCSQVHSDQAAFLSSTWQLGMSSPTAVPRRARSNPFSLSPIHSVTLQRLFLCAVSKNVRSLCGGAASGGVGGVL